MMSSGSIFYFPEKREFTLFFLGMQAAQRESVSPILLPQ